MSLKQFAHRALPTIFTDVVRDLLRRFRHETFHEWEYMPQGWDTKDPRMKGWNDESVLEVLKAKWPMFVRAVQSNGPFRVASPLHCAEGARPLSELDYIWHNVVMAYAYVLTLAARKHDRLSLLDWGGGLGHYYLISKALLPEIEIDYHCKELPLVCRGGRDLFPEASFYDDDERCFQRSYDLVLVSTSLQYSPKWQETVSRLASVSRSYLYITRLPVIEQVASFVVVQRPYPHGYQTEYLSWFLNRRELLSHMSALQMELVREFLIQERPYVHKAPEQGTYRGFLFRPSGRGTSE